MRVFVSVFVFCHCICICAMSVSVRVSVVATELKSLNIDVDCYVCHLDCSVVPRILVLHFRDVCGWCATTILVQLQLVQLELINTSFCSSIRSLSCF